MELWIATNNQWDQNAEGEKTRAFHWSRVVTVHGYQFVSHVTKQHNSWNNKIQNEFGRHNNDLHSSDVFRKIGQIWTFQLAF